MGGVSILAHELSNALVDAGAEVTFLTPRSAASGHDREVLYSTFVDAKSDVSIMEGSNFVRDELPRLNRLFFALNSKKQFDRIVVFHPHYYGQALNRFAQESGIPVSIMFHGTEIRNVLGWKSVGIVASKFISRQHPSIEGEVLKIIRNADEILVNSPYTGGLVRSAGRRKLINVIGCGVNSKNLCRLDNAAVSGERKIKKQQAKIELGLPIDVPIFGSIGRLVKSKNNEMLLKALSLLDQGIGIFIGEGDEKENLIRLAEELGISHRVKWLGLVSEEDKWKCLSAMDVFCLLSKPLSNGSVEGFGIVILEATVAGVPVIACKTGGLPFFIRHDDTGILIEHDDVIGLVNSINRILTSDDFVNDMIARAQKRVIEEFNWQSIASKLINHWSNSTNKRKMELS